MLRNTAKINSSQIEIRVGGQRLVLCFFPRCANNDWWKKKNNNNKTTTTTRVCNEFSFCVSDKTLIRARLWPLIQEVGINIKETNSVSIYRSEYIYLSIYISIYQDLFTFIYLEPFTSIYLFLNLSESVPMCLFLSIYLSIYQSLFIFFYLSI